MFILVLLLLLWVFLSFIIPIVAAYFNGSTYTFAFSLCLLGIVPIFINIFKVRQIRIRRLKKIKAEPGFKNSLGQIHLGTGIYPFWVTALFYVGFGFILSGLTVALLLWFGIIINKAP